MCYLMRNWKRKLNKTKSKTVMINDTINLSVDTKLVSTDKFMVLYGVQLVTNCTPYNTVNGYTYGHDIVPLPCEREILLSKRD